MTMMMTATPALAVATLLAVLAVDVGAVPATTPAEQAVDTLLAQEPRAWRNEHLSSGAVVQLETEPESFLAIQDLATDIWMTRPLPTGALAMDVQIRHDWLDALRTLRGVNESSFTVVHPDLLARIEEQTAARRGNWKPAPPGTEGAEAPRPPTADDFFDEFRPQPEVEAWMQQLAERNPALVRFVPTIGASVEGRPIPALVIGGTGDPSGPAIYFQATLHAREWITTSTVLYIAAAMAESTDPRLRALVSAVTFYIVPTANPDGYVYSWTGPINRMLRKSAPRYPVPPLSPPLPSAEPTCRLHTQTAPQSLMHSEGEMDATRVDHLSCTLTDKGWLAG
jgi:hypothetical protein